MLRQFWSVQNVRTWPLPLAPHYGYVTKHVGSLELAIPLPNPPSTCLSLFIIGFSFPFSRPDGHTNKMLAYTLPTLLASAALAMPTTPFSKTLLGPFGLHDGLSLKAVDPFDRTWIESLTSVGDSYAAGLGAGHAVKAGNQVSSSMSAFYNHSTNQFFASWRSIQTATNTAMAIPTWSTWTI